MVSSPSLTGLKKWIDRPEWASGFQEVLHEHLGAVIEEADLEFDELADLLGEHRIRTLGDCVLEDFLTRHHDEDGRNIVDAYLKRRGLMEPVINRRYMAALRDSVMSLYEVTQVVPGQSFLARDLIRGGPPVLVSESVATRTLEPSEHIAARIVELNGKRIVSAGALMFDHALSEELLREIRSGKRRMRGMLKKMVDERADKPTAAMQRETVDMLAMAAAAPLISAMWLEDKLDRTLGESMPQIVTSEGDDVEFHEMHFPLLQGTSTEAVRAGLDGIAALRPGPADGFWTWVAPRRKAPRDGTRKTVVSATELDDAEVLGTIELGATTLTLSTNSAARAARGRALLTPALDGLVGTPLTKIETLEQAIDADPAESPRRESEIPPEVQAQLLHTVLETHYRGVLSLPIPMLGNISPHDARRTASGRKKLVAWLQLLEDEAASHKAAGNPLGDYDFGWMWAELGIADLRK